MANQDDADRAWVKALAEHPELGPDDEGSDLLKYAREMFGARTGRSMHQDNDGNVVVEFQVTYPFPLNNHLDSVGVSFVLDPRVLTRGAEGVPARIEQDVERQILTHFLPAVEQKALDLGAHTASMKLAIIRTLVTNRYVDTAEARSFTSAIMQVLDS